METTLLWGGLKFLSLQQLVEYLQVLKQKIALISVNLENVFYTVSCFKKTCSQIVKKNKQNVTQIVLLMLLVTLVVVVTLQLVVVTTSC